ncbi:MAG: GNAT family acetyltransferase [Lachnospiraceae bacterium]|nr:GNAT family acetyltransferase [Lachnospiraceae bacterium]
MIDSSTISIQYIKKDDFTGSYRGMRYRLSKTGDGMEVVIWPGPYNYIKTSETKKQRKDFPLTMEGKEDAVKWLNEQYEVQKALWDSALH